MTRLNMLSTIIATDTKHGYSNVISSAFCDLNLRIQEPTQ